MKCGQSEIAFVSPKYQTVVLINLLQAGFWIITEDFRGSGGDKFSYRVCTYLGSPNPLTVRSTAMSAAARLLRLHARIPLRAWMLVPLVCCVLCR